MSAAEEWANFGRASLAHLKERERLWEQFIHDTDQLTFVSAKELQTYADERLTVLTRSLLRALRENDRTKPHAPGYGDR